MHKYGMRLWAAAAVVATSALILPGPAAADPLSEGCVQPNTAGPVTCTYTAGAHALTLPDGVTVAQVTAIGGRGGNHDRLDNATPGGRGARVSGTVPVPAQSRTLYAVVGGNGGDTRPGADPSPGTAGFNGGGSGGAPYWPGRDDYSPGAGGGGASDVRTDATDLGSRLLIAAGGGGAADGFRGGDAGEPGTGAFDSGGQPGTSTTGGAGGDGAGGTSGEAGGLGTGGAGGSTPIGVGVSTISGGGGGGGLFGGGGGGVVYGGGGGGSSLQPADGTTALSNEAPVVIITYQPPATPPGPVCTGSACLPAGTFGSS